MYRNRPQWDMDKYCKTWIDFDGLQDKVKLVNIEEVLSV